MDMTATVRHLTTLTAFFAASLAMGFYAGHMVDTRTDLAATIHNYTCDAGDAEINACIELDTTQVTDRRGAPISLDLNALVHVADGDVDANAWTCLHAGTYAEDFNGHVVVVTRMQAASCNPLAWIGA